MLLNIAQIRLDSKHIVRPINQDAVNDYAQAISEGSVLPKPVIFFDGASYWPGDGRHRITARKQAGYADIEVEIRNGSERDAYIYGITSQDKNGLRLTNEDKRRAVQAVLTDDEWSMKYNDAEIARMCRVGADFVSKARSSLSNTTQQSSNSKLDDQCEQKTGVVVREEIPFTTHSGKRSKKKNSAVKHKSRQQASQSQYNWKQFDSCYGALLREVDNLGRIYNRHNTEDADLLRSDLGAWKSNFKEWAELLKNEKEQACASA